MTSRPLDVLVSVDRESTRTLGRQIEDQLRHAIRDLTLRPGARLPSTRDLARELGSSYEREVVHRDDLVLLKP